MARDEGKPRVPLNDGGASDDRADPAPAPARKPNERRTAPKHQQCPICYEGKMNGVGVPYHTKDRRKRYYKCPECGHTWVVLIRVERIEHKIVDVDETE